jgi:hypothetical protein
LGDEGEYLREEGEYLGDEGEYLGEEGEYASKREKKGRTLGEKKEGEKGTFVFLLVHHCKVKWFDSCLLHHALRSTDVGVGVCPLRH